MCGDVSNSSNREQVVVHAPAKINLALEVGDIRPDGYHELSTVFHAVSLFDIVTAEPAPELRLRLTGREAGELTAGPDNLAWRAAEALARRAGCRPEVGLTVDKAIPVAAGLAGGSADAAATLVACDRLWALGTPLPILLDIAAELGSDVPFALLGGTALGTSRGEHISPVAAGFSAHWVLAIADIGLSTPAVYRELDRIRVDGDAAPAPFGEPTRRLLEQISTASSEGITAAGVEAIGAMLTNQLQPPAIALAPRLAATLAAGRAAGAISGIVSGSGPTCVFLTRGSEDARLLAAALTDQQVCRTALVASGPAYGALESVPAEN